MIDESIQFLTEAESAEVDKALLSSPEKFLARLTISTAKLLTYISKDLNTPIEDLTVPQIVQWFEQDAKRKREEGVNAAVLKWQSEELGQ
jgi:hypothetical protein